MKSVHPASSVRSGVRIYSGVPLVPIVGSLLLADNLKRLVDVLDYGIADERDEVAPFHSLMPPVLPSERIAHSSYGRRLCCAARISIRLACALR